MSINKLAERFLARFIVVKFDPKEAYMEGWKFGWNCGFVCAFIGALVAFGPAIWIAAKKFYS